MTNRERLDSLYKEATKISDMIAFVKEEIKKEDAAQKHSTYGFVIRRSLPSVDGPAFVYKNVDEGNWTTFLLCATVFDTVVGAQEYVEEGSVIWKVTIQEEGSVNG